MPKHIVSVGGGLASTMEMPYRVMMKYGAENVVPVMAMLADDEVSAKPLLEAMERNLGLETHRISIKRLRQTTNADVEEVERLPINQWGRYGIWDIFFYTGRMGNTLSDHCSRVLKREALKLYITQNFLPSDTVLHVGMTWDDANAQTDRRLAVMRNWKELGYRVEFDLADDPTCDRQFMMERAQQLYGFVPELYQEDRSHNNCGGACVKAGKEEWARLLFYHPERYAYHERNELLHQETFGHQYTILRGKVEIIAGRRKTLPLTLHDFRLQMLERQRDVLAKLGKGIEPTLTALRRAGLFKGLDSTPACVFCESVA